MRNQDKKGFGITTKDLLEELGDDFRKTLSELGFEKAVNGYEKMEGCGVGESLYAKRDWITLSTD